MRKLDVTTPHFTDRIAEAQQLVASRDLTPALADADRELLANTLRSLRRTICDRGVAEQLLHGEPHPGNLLDAKSGPLFIDLETCCRGPVEFDLAHVPEEVSERYADADQELVRECGPSLSRWSQRGAGIQATNFRMGNEQRENSSAPYEGIHRGRRSMSRGAGSCSVQLLIERFVEPRQRSCGVSRREDRRAYHTGSCLIPTRHAALAPLRAERAHSPG